MPSFYIGGSFLILSLEREGAARLSEANASWIGWVGQVSMAEHIFHEGEQEQRREAESLQVPLGLQLESQRVLKTELVEGDVFTDVVQLTG